jgi:hypothetical protein
MIPSGVVKTKFVIPKALADRFAQAGRSNVLLTS